MHFVLLNQVLFRQNDKFDILWYFYLLHLFLESILSIRKCSVSRLNFKHHGGKTSIDLPVDNKSRNTQALVCLGF